MALRSLIFHIDVNSAYLSWTAVQLLKDGKDEDIRLIPAAIGGDREKRHGVILAKSRPAKKFGVRTGEPIVSALKKCPSLKLFSPDFELYDKNSMAFLDILSRYSPKVEQYSIDEAFADMTGTELLYESPESAASSIRNTIYDELGFNVNIGISENRLLAKMASDVDPPGGIYTLFQSEISEKLWPLDIGKLFMAGRSSQETLRSLGIHTIGQLAKSDPEVIKAHLKKHGETLYRFANGIDDGENISRISKDKEIGNSITIPQDVDDAEAAKNILLSLCETVCTRLRHEGLKAGCVSVRITDCNFRGKTHQKVLTVLTNVTDEIFYEVSELFDELWDGTPIRLLGVQTSRLEEKSYRQYNLFDAEKFDKLEKLDNCIDDIRQRYGEDAIKRASFIDNETYKPAGKTSKDKR